jgi:hypothetical protein
MANFAFFTITVWVHKSRKMSWTGGVLGVEVKYGQKDTDHFRHLSTNVLTLLKLL